MDRPSREDEGPPAKRPHIEAPANKNEVSLPLSPPYDPDEFPIVAEESATFDPLTVCFVSQTNTEHACERVVAQHSPVINELMKQHGNVSRIHFACSTDALICLIRYLHYAVAPTKRPPLFPSEVVVELIWVSKRLGL